jgi:hypothetical protein
MATATKYQFELSQVAAALIKAQNIHEGKWWVAFELVMATGMVGPAPPDLMPGAVMQIKRLLLTRADESTLAHFIVDAAEANPAPRAKPTASKPK